MEYKEKLKSFKLKKAPGSEDDYLNVLQATETVGGKVTSIGEMGFDERGAIILRNKTSSLHGLLSNLLNTLTTASTALAGNPTTEPAAAAAGAALAASIVAIQGELNTLLSAS